MTGTPHLPRRVVGPPAAVGSPAAATVICVAAVVATG